MLPFSKIPSILMNAPVFIDAVNNRGEIVFWNKSAESITGYGQDEIIYNPNVWNMLYPDKQYREKTFVSASIKLWDIKGELWNITAKNGQCVGLWVSLIKVDNILKNINADRLAVGVLSSETSQSCLISELPNGCKAGELSAKIALKIEKLDKMPAISKKSLT